MDENNQFNRRTRTRPPYDLRRKVLLKNFLREQMSNAPDESESPSEATADRENLDPVVAQSSSEVIEENVAISTTEETGVETEAEVEPSKNVAQGLENEDSKSESEKRGVQHHPNSPWKSTLAFDFSKVTELKLSRLNPVKRKSTPLSPEDIKLLSKKKGESSKTNGGPSKEASKTPDLITVEVDATQVLTHLPNKLVTQLKDKTVIKFKRKGVTKAKNAVQNTKTQSKIFSVDVKARKHHLKDLKNKIKKCLSMMQDILSKKKVTNNDSKVLVPEYNLNMRSNQQDTSIVVQILDPQTGESSLKSDSSNLCTDKKSHPEVQKRKEHPPSTSTLISKQTTSGVDSVHSRASTSFSVSTQCIPDDMNWSLHEIRKLERANRRLREENKLLSDSLSTIMADVDVAFNSFQNNANSPASSISYETNNGRPAYVKPIKAKVLRSKSVQEQAARRREIRKHLSSRSVCDHPYSRISPRNLYRAKPCIITPYSSSREVPFSNPDLPSILPTHLNHNYSKPLNRRSSMPEGNYRRPVLCRRFSCAQESQIACNRRACHCCQ